MELPVLAKLTWKARRISSPTAVYGSGRVPHVRPGVHGPKTDFSNAFTPCATTLALRRSLLARLAERWKGLRPVFFGPCTLGRTWGTRPGKRALLLAQGRACSLVHRKRSYPTSNLDSSEVQPSPFDKLRAGSAGLIFQSVGFRAHTSALICSI
jgi:hypothetical protein